MGEIKKFTVPESEEDKARRKLGEAVRRTRELVSEEEFEADLATTRRATAEIQASTWLRGEILDRLTEAPEADFVKIDLEELALKAFPTGPTAEEMDHFEARVQEVMREAEEFLRTIGLEGWNIKDSVRDNSQGGRQLVLKRMKKRGI